jgi:hypothetical protein
MKRKMQVPMKAKANPKASKEQAKTAKMEKGKKAK